VLEEDGKSERRSEKDRRPKKGADEGHLVSEGLLVQSPCRGKGN